MEKIVNKLKKHSENSLIIISKIEDRITSVLADGVFGYNMAFVSPGLAQKYGGHTAVATFNENEDVHNFVNIKHLKERFTSNTQFFILNVQTEIEEEIN